MCQRIRFGVSLRQSGQSIVNLHRGERLRGGVTEALSLVINFAKEVILVRSGRRREIKSMARTGWVATGDTSVEFQSLTFLFRCVPTVKTSDKIRSA
eukprot:2472800-Rhodomonas_salina.4